MTVVVNELDVVPADGGPPPPAPAAGALSPAQAQRMTERANRIRAERARRLRAY
jgi:hypothetical protein